MQLRRHVPTILISMVVAAVTASAPAIAHGVQHALFAHNADRVDGKHAVGASASLGNAGGRLVAHNSGGRLPARFIPKVNNAGNLDGFNSTEFFRNWTMVEGEHVTIAAVNGFGTATADCPDGMQALGGGWNQIDGVPSIDVFRNHPNSDGEGWEVTGKNVSTLTDRTFFAFVICAQVV